MADVTISQLTKGTPSGNHLLPYSTGSSTLGVPVSALFQGTNKVGIGVNSTLFNNSLVIKGIDSPTFTGNQPLGLGLLNGGNYDLTGIDFKNLTGNSLAGRIGVEVTGAGGYMKFGTSNNYSTGITNTALIIDPNGAVTKPNQPAFAIQAVQRQYNYITANWSKITGLSPINQNNINANSTFDFVNSRYVAPIGGIYHISGMLRLDPSPASWLYIVPFINGNAYYHTTGALPSLNVVYPPTGFSATNLSMLIKLDVNDILEFYFGASNNNTYTIYPQTCFYGYLLG